ncbi:hypothetical protein BX589_115176 [Paraburkholderia fungorum]|jgi:hypothetical protein|uniref:hypothetical protein n=1 Tax=Paraburkholderia fungorum TaxID=134537 RepID=UPI000D064A44|nr:hypothetical protein [Paraburkholderia fungorum]PRZ52296.1 hypothetical protein BX589_115176 [Paraburkholderia fungorum]
MSNVQMTPQRYAKILEEYDLVLGHACEMSDRLTWRLVVQHYLSYAETIFTKLLWHAISLLKLSPTLPFALSQLKLSHAGDPGALQLVAMPLQYSMAFLAKTVFGIESLRAEARLQTSADLRHILESWSFLAEHGVKGVGR